MAEYTGPMNTMYGGTAYLQYMQQLAAEREAAADPREQAQQGLLGSAGASNAFAGQGQANYGAMTDRGNAYLDRLDRLANGQDSLSREQLRQGLTQQLSQQRSMAASASPQNAAMAARTAATQMGRVGSGMAGNAAMAGIAERNAATQAMGNAILGMRGQDVQAALGSRGNTNTAYGNILGEQRDNSPGFWDYATGLLGAGMSAAATASTGGATKSDERAKTEIKDADADSRKMLDGLRAYTYRYKNERDGKGSQYGIMAQDLEKSGLGHAVMDTPSGKMVHGAKLATGLAALVSSVHRRVSKLEGKGK